MYKHFNMMSNKYSLLSIIW